MINFYEEDEEATCKFYLHVQNKGSREVKRKAKHYNLEMILAIGYHVRSHIKIEPNETHIARIIPEDYFDMIEAYELSQGRVNTKIKPAFGLVDFVSEEADGESRLIIITPNIHVFKDTYVEEDYHSIRNRTIVYEVKDEEIIEYQLNQVIKIR